MVDFLQRDDVGRVLADLVDELHFPSVPPQHLPGHAVEPTQVRTQPGQTVRQHVELQHPQHHVAVAVAGAASAATVLLQGVRPRQRQEPPRRGVLDPCAADGDLQEEECLRNEEQHRLHDGPWTENEKWKKVGRSRESGVGEGRGKNCSHARRTLILSKVKTFVQSPANKSMSHILGKGESFPSLSVSAKREPYSFCPKNVTFVWELHSKKCGQTQEKSQK